MSKYQRLPSGILPGHYNSVACSNGIIIPLGDKKIILLAGQMAIDSEGKVQYEDMPGEQAGYIFRKIQRLLMEAGASLDDIIRVVVYVTDMSYLSDISYVRSQYVIFAQPVSTYVGVNELAVKGCKVEIEVTAII